VLLIGGALTAAAVAGAAYRRMASGSRRAEGTGVDGERLALGWGEGVARPEHRIVRTRDGADLAVWDLRGTAADASVVVLPHCWGCSHEVWVPVARRLREEGYRVVLYDQRGHGASTRGTAPIAIETLAHDLEAVLEATDVRDAVLAGHSMGGMTIMSLATHRPDVLRERAKATVLVATAASNSGGNYPDRGLQLARSVMASSVVSRAMTMRNGHIFVRGVFGTNPVRAHMDLTRELFGTCDGDVRADWMAALATLNLVEGIATIDLPTTVVVGGRDTLTVPAKADQMVSTIPGARLVTLKDRGHMLPLEDPDAVTDEIVRAVKG
jgi:pimeloyl-ACP methyl ester carboxylesterase